MPHRPAHYRRLAGGVIPAGLPLVLGHENAGWVHAAGPAAGDLAAGDPVLCHPGLTCGACPACRAGDDMRCAAGPPLSGVTCDGGMAELVKTSARAIVKLDAGADPADLAGLADAGLTAYHAVRKAIPALGPGTTAVAVGAGGLGHIAIQCLKAVTPAQVIAVDTSQDAVKLALDCGADHAICADGKQAEQVRDLTGPGANAVFNFVGEDATIANSVAMLRPGGTYYLAGYGGTVTLPTIPLILAEVSIVANLIGTSSDLAALATLARQGKVTPAAPATRWTQPPTRSRTSATAASTAAPSSSPADHRQGAGTRPAAPGRPARGPGSPVIPISPGPGGSACPVASGRRSSPAPGYQQPDTHNGQHDAEHEPRCRHDQVAPGHPRRPCCRRCWATSAPGKRASLVKVPW